MVKRTKAQYVCNNCGAVSSRWSGRCLNCGEWNTLEEQLAPSAISGMVSSGKSLDPQNVAAAASVDKPRLSTGSAETDAVFGGGLVAGSVNLLAGQPGIGKSTLLLQLAYAV